MRRLFFKPRITTPPGRDVFTSLPPELLLDITEYLSPYDKSNLRLTCYPLTSCDISSFPPPHRDTHAGRIFQEPNSLTPPCSFSCDKELGSSHHVTGKACRAQKI
ncbi:hypothetical protein EX30DRAFT_210920 [Ascodesmis nigricans]|uniref:F-box domain-containing protein n=1 Tax=Ascodesmis nigricans TaxID=341454 RepID=A0A4S2MJQ3_9PEZI|nr:hypothetical protein EX30DRAFT_210920 [Ascodesmis nigricans]